MKTTTNRRADHAVDSARFEALLDKLVAVRMDLRPVCGSHDTSAAPVAYSGTMSTACDILHSAIVDLRNIVSQIDGPPH